MNWWHSNFCLLLSAVTCSHTETLNSGQTWTLSMNAFTVKPVPVKNRFVSVSSAPRSLLVAAGSWMCRDLLALENLQHYLPPASVVLLMFSQLAFVGHFIVRATECFAFLLPLLWEKSYSSGNVKQMKNVIMMLVGRLVDYCVADCEGWQLISVECPSTNGCLFLLAVSFAVDFSFLFF